MAGMNMSIAFQERLSAPSQPPLIHAKRGCPPGGRRQPPPPGAFVIITNVHTTWTGCIMMIDRVHHDGLHRDTAPHTPPLF